MGKDELSLEAYKQTREFPANRQSCCQKSAGGKPQKGDSERLFLQWAHLLRNA